MELNASERMLGLKVVYYGPALGGKTTNLITIHGLTDPERRTEMVSISTSDDRTLFFDLLPLGLGHFIGYELKLKLYTVPGQVQFDVTRRKVLAGADAVVFVADSQKAQADANLLSLKNLRVNLTQNKLDPQAIPIVFQYNKRDLPKLMDLREMNDALNERKVPAFPAIATTGVGVMECLAAAVAVAFGGLAANHRIASQNEAKRAAAGIRDALLALSVKPQEGVMGMGGVGGPASAPSRADARAGGAVASTWTHRADVQVQDEVDLLEQAVSANMALSERLSDAQVGSEKVGRRERQIRALCNVARLAEEAADPGAIGKEVMKLALESLGLTRGSLLFRTPEGALVAHFLLGHRTDPLSAIPSPPAGSVAERLIAAGRPLLSRDLHLDVLFGEMHPATAGVFSVLFAPLRSPEGLPGGLFLYGCEPGGPFDENDGLFVEAACRIASLARARTGIAPAR